MQEPKADKDDEFCHKVNEALNNPDAAVAAAMAEEGGGGMRGLPSNLASALAGQLGERSICCVELGLLQYMFRSPHNAVRQTADCPVLASEHVSTLQSLFTNNVLSAVSCVLLSGSQSIEITHIKILLVLVILNFSLLLPLWCKKMCNRRYWVRSIFQRRGSRELTTIWSVNCICTMQSTFYRNALVQAF